MRLIITLFALFLSMHLFAQMTDAIYLNNGNVYRGTIINSTPENTSIETFCGNTLLFKTTEIKEIKKEKYSPFSHVKNKGYFNYTSMGALVGSQSDEKTAMFSILMEHNYQINKIVSVGAVTGIEWYDVSVIPIGLNFKLMAPQKRNMTLFVGLSGGYTIPLEEYTNENFVVKETNGGYFFNSEIGITFPSMGNANLFITMGYRYQELSYVREDWWYDEITQATTYNRFAIRVGVCLH